MHIPQYAWRKGSIKERLRSNFYSIEEFADSMVAIATYVYTYVSRSADFHNSITVHEEEPPSDRNSCNKGAKQIIRLYLHVLLEDLRTYALLTEASVVQSGNTRGTTILAREDRFHSRGTTLQQCAREARVLEDNLRV